MSRSGYSDDLSTWELIKYRGQVHSSLRGLRGLEFLRELREALDALPEKTLCGGDLQRPDGMCCAIGAVGKLRGMDMTKMDAESMTENGKLGKLFNIADCLVREIEYENDDSEYGFWNQRDDETVEQYYARRDVLRWSRMSVWVDARIKEAEAFREKRGWSND